VEAVFSRDIMGKSAVDFLVGSHCHFTFKFLNELIRRNKKSMEFFFKPRGIAVVGATANPAKGAYFMRNNLRSSE
jgi:hypothetical protein